jgi:hypothetical protein
MGRSLGIRADAPRYRNWGFVNQVRSDMRVRPARLDGMKEGDEAVCVLAVPKSSSIPHFLQFIEHFTLLSLDSTSCEASPGL